ncbi:MAG: ribonuclease Z, partial [Bacteroidia bacterium]|nr:ribonuclease Z [Bacteroidia bacterium]
MSLDVTILGSGSALPMLGRMPSAHAVQSGGATFLVDCGEGTQMRLLASRISFDTIRA